MELEPHAEELRLKTIEETLCMQSSVPGVRPGALAKKMSVEAVPGQRLKQCIIPYNLEAEGRLR